MFINDNGFDVQNIQYSSDRVYISEGAVVGIVFGWLVGAIGFFILGICLIRLYFSRRKNNSDS